MTRMERTLLNEICTMEICQATGTAGMRKPCFVQHGRENIVLAPCSKGRRPRANHPAVHFSAGSRILSEIPLPDITTLRRFKQYDVERYGIYIDAGHIRLENERTVVLIGKTSACLSYDSKGRHEVILMHGAQASIQASAWAVVFVSGEHGCQVIKSNRQGDDFMTDRFYIDGKDAFHGIRCFRAGGRLQRACGLSVIEIRQEQ